MAETQRGLRASDRSPLVATLIPTVLVTIWHVPLFFSDLSWVRFIQEPLVVVVETLGPCGMDSCSILRACWTRMIRQTLEATMREDIPSASRNGTIPRRRDV